jgi:hypothetical protein
MKLNIKFLLLLILLNGLAVAGCVISSTSWFVSLAILVLGNVTVFHKRSYRIQQELAKADADSKIDELVAAENATRKLLKEVISTVRSQASKLKKHDEMFTRLHTELSRHRGGQQKLVGSRNQNASVPEAPERESRARIDAAVLESVRKNARAERPSDASGKVV